MYHHGCFLNTQYPAFGSVELDVGDMKALAQSQNFRVDPVPSFPVRSRINWNTQEILYSEDLSGFQLDFALGIEVGHIYLNHEAPIRRLNSLFDSLPEDADDWFLRYTHDTMRAEAVYFASYALFPGKKISELRYDKKNQRPLPQEQIKAQLLQEAKKRYSDASNHDQIEQLLNLRLAGHFLLNDLVPFAKRYATEVT